MDTFEGRKEAKQEWLKRRRVSGEKTDDFLWTDGQTKNRRTRERSLR